jgi:hypothetical protein
MRSGAGDETCSISRDVKMFELMCHKGSGYLAFVDDSRPPP